MSFTVRLRVLETRDWKTSAGIGLVFHADIGNCLAGSVAAWKFSKSLLAPLGARHKMTISGWENGLAGGQFSCRILENGWLAGQLRFPAHGVLL